VPALDIIDKVVCRAVCRLVEVTEMPRLTRFELDVKRMLPIDEAMASLVATPAP
jgi:hypothetical protein